MSEIQDPVQQAIILGNVGSIAGHVNQLLSNNTPPQAILDHHLLPGMAIVGERFKRNEMFLPQVLMSAQAMQTAIDILKPLLIGDPQAQARQKIIMGTVKGDMHDIGKNLVRIMLLGAGFEVLDLGVNVPPQRFVDNAREYQADIVCLSALLSSTMNNMQEVISLFRADAHLHDTRILIGGAPVSRAFAETIGADGYAPSAPLAVNLVQTLSQN